MNVSRAKRIAQNIITLPTLPTVVAKMIELMDDPGTSASALGKLVSTDQVLTAKILKLANSSYYGFPRRIGTVNLAVVLLGFNTLRDIGLSVSVIGQFSKDGGNGYFDYSRFWEHSIGCGVGAKTLAKGYFHQVSGEAFVAGLLHDIGKLVLAQYMKPEFEAVINLVQERKILFMEAEEIVMGVTHAHMGSWLAKRWNLPKQLVEALAYHHTPEKARRNPQLTALVHFADILCRRGGIGFAGDEGIPDLSPEAVELLNLKQDEDGQINYDYYLSMLNSELEKAETFVNIIKDKETADGRK